MLAARFLSASLPDRVHDLVELLGFRATELGNLLLQLDGRSAELLLRLAGRLVQVADVSVQLSQASLGVGVKAQKFDAHLRNEVVELRGPFCEKVRKRLEGLLRGAVFL